jgi:hypothetical protein
VLAEQHRIEVPVQGSGRLTSNSSSAEPLTAALFPVASQAETACDERNSCRDSRSGLAVMATRGQAVHPGPAAGDRAAAQPTHRPGHGAGQSAGTDRPQLAQLLQTTLQ